MCSNICSFASAYTEIKGNSAISTLENSSVSKVSSSFTGVKRDNSDGRYYYYKNGKKAAPGKGWKKYGKVYYYFKNKTVTYASFVYRKESGEMTLRRLTTKGTYIKTTRIFKLPGGKYANFVEGIKKAPGKGWIVKGNAAYYFANNSSVAASKTYTKGNKIFKIWNGDTKSYKKDTGRTGIMESSIYPFLGNASYYYVYKGKITSLSDWKKIDNTLYVATGNKNYITMRLQKVNGAWEYTKSSNGKKFTKQKNTTVTINEVTYSFDSSGKCNYVYYKKNKKLMQANTKGGNTSYSDVKDDNVTLGDGTVVIVVGGSVVSDSNETGEGSCQHRVYPVFKTVEHTCCNYCGIDTATDNYAQGDYGLHLGICGSYKYDERAGIWDFGGGTCSIRSVYTDEVNYYVCTECYEVFNVSDGEKYLKTEHPYITKVKNECPHNWRTIYVTSPNMARSPVSLIDYNNIDHYYCLNCHGIKYTANGEILYLYMPKIEN